MGDAHPVDDAALAVELRQAPSRGEGAEQIGPALLYAGDGGDDLLKDVEDCLADL